MLGMAKLKGLEMFNCSDWYLDEFEMEFTAQLKLTTANVTTKRRYQASNGEAAE